MTSKSNFLVGKSDFSFEPRSFGPNGKHILILNTMLLTRRSCLSSLRYWNPLRSLHYNSVSQSYGSQKSVSYKIQNDTISKEPSVPSSSKPSSEDHQYSKVYSLYQS